MEFPTPSRPAAPTCRKALSQLRGRGARLDVRPHHEATTTTKASRREDFKSPLVGLRVLRAFVVTSQPRRMMSRASTVGCPRTWDRPCRHAPIAAARGVCYACLPQVKGRTPCRSHPSISRVSTAPPRLLRQPSPGCPAAAAPRVREAGGEDRDTEDVLPCFPHSLNRRASACGSGRTPAPRPSRGPRSGARWLRSRGAGDRSTPGYPQRFQMLAGECTSSGTGYPHVFHKTRVLVGS